MSDHREFYEENIPCGGEWEGGRPDCTSPWVRAGTALCEICWGELEPCPRCGVRPALEGGDPCAGCWGDLMDKD